MDPSVAAVILSVPFDHSPNVIHIKNGVTLGMD